VFRAEKEHGIVHQEARELDGVVVRDSESKPSAKAVGSSGPPCCAPSSEGIRALLKNRTDVAKADAR
jgi:hypothetical protein